MRLPGIRFATGTLLTMLPDPVRDLLPRPRLVRECAGGVRIELRALGGPGTERAARALEKRLLAAGADRAEVNGALGCVFVGRDAAGEADTADGFDEGSVAAFVAVVEELDRVAAADGPPATDSTPADEEDGSCAEKGSDGGRLFDGVEQQARAAVSLGLHLVGVGVALAGQVARVPKLPPVVPAITGLVEHTPRVRREIEERLGRQTAEALLASTRVVTHALALRPVALLIDSAAAAGRYLDARAGRRAWESREEELAAAPGAYRHIRMAVTPRPVRLPRGPVERYADAASPAALAAQGLTAVVGADRRRALPVLVAATPRAARLGREAFTGAVVRALAGRGTIVLDHHALHRMDRVDTVVLDAGVLTTGRWAVHGVVPLDPGVDRDELHVRLYSLLDLTDPGARRERDGWTAEPVTSDARAVTLAGRAVAARRGRAPDARAGAPEATGRADVAGWRRQGVRPVMVARHGTAVALVGLAPEPAPLAAAVAAAPGDACAVVLAGGDAGLAGRLGVERTVPGGARLAASVRALQAEGHGVAVVTRRWRRALVQADLAIGVLTGQEPGVTRPGVTGPGVTGPGGGWPGGGGPGVTGLPGAGPGAGEGGAGLPGTGEGAAGSQGAGRVPWDADVIGGFDGAHLLLSCLPHARRAARRGVRVAATGAVVGAGLAAVGPARNALRRAHLAADCTSVAALAAGAWTGRRAARQAPPIPADHTPWHAMPVQDVLDRLRTSPHGLTETQAHHRRTTGSPAEPTAPGRGVAGRADGAPRSRGGAVSRAAQGAGSLARACVSELANPLTPVLAAGAGMSAAVGSVLDAGLIAGVMAAGALLGGAQRRGADRALHRLTRVTAPPVRLRRPAGAMTAVPDDLVPGDVVELRAGDAVPADCRLIEAAGLEVDESALTGESQLVVKTAAPTAAAAIADRASMVYRGTTVAAGHGLAAVVAVGESTEWGRTARLAAAGPPPSGVELRLRALSRRILPASIGSGVLLMLIELLRGTPVAAAVAPAVSLAVAAVPEGLPFVATVAELASAKRLSARDALVRNPSTIEALGRVDVLCFDKTGTLTEGRITLARVSDGRTDRPVGELTPELEAVVAAALRACPRHEDGRAVPHPTDRAVVAGARGLGVTQEGWRRTDELPFEPARGYHAVLGLANGRCLLSVKGAPEAVLTHCAGVARGTGTDPLDDGVRRELAKEVDRLARQGHRVLAVAEREASSRADLEESRIDRLRLLGFLCLADPVRPTAKRSVEGLMRAGVRVVMITGDHPSTAEAIAAEINALNGRRVMTGPELDRLDDDALAEVLPEVAVFARVTPGHKARIVAGLRRAGRVVAVTGDGANDVPAIRLADVGVALGPQATPAARAAADIVVTDDRIETIIDAIVEGRAMWGSVRDALGMLLGGNIGEIAFTLGSSLLTGRSALNARQLLLVNLLTDMLPAMAVAVRAPGASSPERLLAEGPEASLGAALSRDIRLRAVTSAGAAGAAWLLARMTGTRARADTVGLVGLVGAQLLQTLAVGGRDRLVLLAALSSLAVLAAAVSVPGLSGLFGCRPIGPVGWGIGLGCAAVAVLVAGLVERAASARVHRPVR
ncbi:cation-translocating P-type ATPase [Nonomuraea indica]|uniref:cation-translocating P-type ATPase n=1 Tax=Nonomuraea indica TaxID=1581193 RepID=UPI001FE3E46F|nr:HAD-IC family P-type ATPase [Nonomuraea indica]